MTEDKAFHTNYMEGMSKFQGALNKAFWHEMLHHLTGRHDELMNFDDVRSRLHLHEELYQGIQDVPLEKIAGSVGRYKDFTSSFLPKSNKMKERWSRVYAVANSMQGPPPVDLYKVGDVYFVRDGNHRVSVARQLGSKSIEAHVIELPTSVPLHVGMTEQEMESAEAYAYFIEETGLARAVSNHESIELTIPSRYHELMGYIFLHQRVLEQLEAQPVTTEAATADWYHQVYKPAIEMIRKYEVLARVKNKKSARTEGDLFMWLMDNLMDLRHQYGDQSPVRSFSGAIKTYLEEEKVEAPQELASENDQTVLLTREQVLKAQKSARAKRASKDG